MPHTIGYVRFSTKKQEGKDSKGRQEANIERLLKTEGWGKLADPPDPANPDRRVPDEWVRDEGKSAYKGHHLNGGNLGRLADRVRAGEVAPGTVLIVEQLDRLSRQGHNEAYQWLLEMTGRGLRIAVTEINRIFDTASLQASWTDAIEILMKGSLAHHESLQKSKRVKGGWAAKQAKVQSGERQVLTARCPGWLTVRPDRSGYDLIPERAETVKRIFELVGEGNGLAKVVKKLNSEGRAPWGPYGGGWSPTHIIRIIQSPSPEGDYVPFFTDPDKPNGERVVGMYPRAVEADLVASARVGLASRRGTGGWSYDTYSNLFTGLMQCTGCMGKMTVRRGPVYREGVRISPGYVSCMSNSLGRGCDRKEWFQYMPFEEAALADILHLALDSRFFRKMDRTVECQRAYAEAGKAVTDLETRMSNIMSQMEGVTNAKPLQLRYQQLDTLRQQAEDQRAVAADELQRARGEVSGSEHLARVLEVHQAMMSEEKAVRQEARMRVQATLPSVVSHVLCDAQDESQGGQKTISLVLGNGAVAIKYDNRGKRLFASDAPLQLMVRGDDQVRVGLGSSDQGPSSQVDAMLRRHTPSRPKRSR